MSDQKPKIDLKARLGKKPAGAPAPVAAPLGGSSIPPPMGVGVQRPSAPQVRAPVPVFGGAPQMTPSGVPAPPFQAPSAPPRIDPSNPYGALPPQAAPSNRPAAIRIEVGEEIHEARRKARKKIMVLSLVTAFVGGVIGYAVGGGVERGKGADSAINGAKMLITEINKANSEAQKLADTLKAAKEDLTKGKYPEKPVSDLGAINIPFSGTNLAGKGIGRFKAEILSQLIQYTNRATETNDQKEKVQSVLAGAKKGLMELLEQKDKPQVRWAVIMGDTSAGPMAAMKLIPKAFPITEAWPDDFKVGSGKDELTFRRYKKGDPISESSPYFVPVDPGTQGAVCSSDVVIKLRRELNDLETALRGDNTPGQEEVGLIDSGNKLIERLKIIGSTGE